MSFPWNRPERNDRLTLKVDPKPDADRARIASAMDDIYINIAGEDDNDAYTVLLTDVS